MEIVVLNKNSSDIKCFQRFWLLQKAACSDGREGTKIALPKDNLTPSFERENVFPF